MKIDIPIEGDATLTPREHRILRLLFKRRDLLNAPADGEVSLRWQEKKPLVTARWQQLDGTE